MEQISKNDGVSPVIAIMLMLVVTIIIAAVVSSFAGGAINGQKKVPQASITSSFSIVEGLEIRHNGGDPIPMNDVIFTIWDGPTFGPNLEQNTKQVLDMTKMTDSSGTQVKFANGTYVSSVFKSGDTFTIDTDDCDCDILQPSVAPSDYVTGSGTSYSGAQPSRWSLCIKNANSIGKQFVISLSNKDGRSIATADVPVKA